MLHGSRKNRIFQELKAFEKVELAAGEEKQICFTLDKQDFSHHDVQKDVFAGEWDL